MRLEHIKTGNRIEITLKKEPPSGRVLISQVESVYDNDQMLVLMPISYGKLVTLPLDVIYSFIFFSDKGMYKYDGKIVKYIKEENYNFMVVKIVSEGEKIQRRSFFRFNCLLPIRFSKALDNGKHEEAETASDMLPLTVENINKDTELFKGVIKDIGGGGIRFISNDNVEVEDKIKSLILLKDDYIVVIGKVLHKQYFPKSNYRFQYRVEFMGIKEEEQAQIVKFIFDEQRRVLQRTKSLAND